MPASFPCLDRLTKDYAYWDDTADYLQTNDATYLSSNYLNQMLEDNHLNSVAIYDVDDNLRYEKNYDLGSCLERLPHAGMYTDVLETFKKSSKNALNGVFRNNDKLQMVAVRSIKGSDGLDQVFGTMNFTRPVDNVLMDNLSRQLRFDVNIQSVDMVKNTSLFAKITVEQPVYIQLTDHNQLGAYFYLLDLSKKIAAVAQISVPRQLYLELVPIKANALFILVTVRK